MKAERILVSGFDFVALTGVTIDQEIGKHGLAVVSGYISDDKVKEYQRKLMRNAWITIKAVDEKEKTQVLMAGIAAGFTFDRKPHETHLTLEIMTGTYLMDGFRHFRTFQNESKTYIGIMEMLNKAYGDNSVKGEDSAYTPAPDFLLQYQENDWEFITKIASRLGYYITPAADREGIYYYVGKGVTKSYKLPSDTFYSAKKHVGKYMKENSGEANSKEKNSQAEQDYVEYEVKDRETYSLWNQIYFENKGGYIYKIHSEFVGEELVHTYFLRPESAMYRKPYYNLKQTGCSFDAVVTAVKEDQVQINVTGDENSKQKITKWFPYATVYSSPSGPGWYCMPEEGDHVRLCIPSEEEKAYVISAVHKETSKDRKNPAHKSLKTKYGKELLFTPDSIVLTNNKGMEIKISDGEGIKITSDKDISINSAGNMTISSDNASLMIAGTETVDVSQGGASIHMDDDIAFTGGKFRIQ